MRLAGNRGGEKVDVTAGFVIDASGPRGFLTTALGTGSAPQKWLPPTQGLFSHFEDVGLWDDVMPSKGAPYPPDAAALHHVFPGGWIWMLRFNNGITSAGAALTDPLAAAFRAADGAAAWDRLLEALPSVRRQFASARATLPFVHAPRVAFRCHEVVGNKMGAVAFCRRRHRPAAVDRLPAHPSRAGDACSTFSKRHRLGTEREVALRDYERTTQTELDVTEQLVGALYNCMGDPGIFKRLSLLYFAAASYSETVRRLGRPHLAPGFLLNSHRGFGVELRECATLAAQVPSGAPRSALFDRIDRAIEPFDTAGLLDRSRRDWYPMLASDLVSSASKLEASA